MYSPDTRAFALTSGAQARPEGGHYRPTGSALRTRTKIYGSTDPLSKSVCFFPLSARRHLQRLVGNFVGERCIFILVESHFIHGVRPLAKALNSTLAI